VKIRNANIAGCTVAVLALITIGCSMTKMTANQTVAILVESMPAYDRETNLEFAEQSITGNLKMIEGLLEVTPDNSDLLTLASSSFARYAFGFIEEKIDVADSRYDLDEVDRRIAQAADFYERAKSYGLRRIEQSHKNFSKILELDLDALASEMAHFDEKDVPGLFWTAYAWGSLINLKQDEPEHLANLPKVDLMMRRVLELDENFFFGGPHFFYGVYYGGRPETLGGDPEKAKVHFQRAIQITGGKYLMTRFLLAKYYAVSVQDRELFEQTLREITIAPPDIFPEQGLANELAKRNARRWLERVDEVFF
jgi:tetratricopeptide (TPR) repeat protein